MPPFSFGITFKFFKSMSCLLKVTCPANADLSKRWSFVCCWCSANRVLSEQSVSPIYLSSQSLQEISWTTPVCFSSGTESLIPCDRLQVHFPARLTTLISKWVSTLFICSLTPLTYGKTVVSLGSSFFFFSLFPSFRFFRLASPFRRVLWTNDLG